MTNMIYTVMPALPKKHHTNAVVLPSEWNACPLSSIVEEISETVGTRKIETISISAGIGFVNQAEKFGRELSGKQYEKYIVLHKGDFSYNKGNSNIYPQGCIYRLNNRTEAAVPNVFESFRVSVGNPDYYEQLFLSGFLNRQLYSKINRGVRDNGLLNLKGKDFYSCEVPCPPLAEQERIAEILIQCDHVIELKEQKLDELKQLKKEFLQKMFPAKGCDTPEIRFPGFTGAWEQRKLGEISSIKTGPFGTQLSAKEYVESGVPVINVKNIGSNAIIAENLDYVSGETFLRLKEHILHNGDIVFGRKGALNRHAMIQKTQDGWIQGSDCIRVKLNVDDSNYLDAYLQVPNVLQHLSKIAYGSTMLTLTTDMLYSVPVELPQLCEEKKIGDFFKILNNLITLHQRELEETKTYKKALAKLLLTGIVRVQG